MNKPRQADLDAVLAYTANRTGYYKQEEYTLAGAWEELPIINKDIYKQNTPPKGDGLFAGEMADCMVSVSSGSMGEPAYVVRDMDDFRGQGRDFIGLEAGKGDRALNLFMPGMWGVFSSANISLMQCGCTILPAGGTGLDAAKLKEIIRLIRDFQVNFLLGVPSTIIAVANALANEKEAATCIEKIFCLGEKLPQASLDHIRGIFKNAVIKSKYGCMESAGIGYQCRDLEANQYHVFPDRYVEIIESDSTRVLESGKEGRIIVTTLNKRLVPLIRYDTGDLGKLTREDCACGETEVLRVLNRKDGEFIIGSIHLKFSRIEELAGGIKGLPANYQVRLDKERGLDRLSLCFETDGVLPHKDRLAAILRSGITGLYPDMSEAIASKKISDINIEFLPEGKLERQGQSGKIKRIVDLR